MTMQAVMKWAGVLSNEMLNNRVSDKEQYITLLIGDALKDYDSYFNRGKQNAGRTFPAYKRFILGLRYSEFYAEDGFTNDSDYMQASEKQCVALNYLGVNYEKLIQTCKRILGASF